MHRLLWLLIPFLFQSQAWAWGDIGHGAIGYIAESLLTSQGKSFVFLQLGHDPLSVAAVFPDQVRSDDRFKSFAPYHFLEIPRGYTFATLPKELRAEKDAHTIISKAPDLLSIRNPPLSPPHQAVLFKYLVHLVGDVHQPLHVGNGRDRGANLCQVKWENPKTGKTVATNLHTAWDENLISNIQFEFEKSATLAPGQKRWFGYRELGDLIMAEVKAGTLQVNFAKVSADAPEVWYSESQALHDVAYPGGNKIAPEDRLYCKIVDPQTGKVVNGKFDETQIPTLDAAFAAQALPVIKSQILKAGYRLADMINKMGAKDALPAWTEQFEKELFQKMDIKN